VTIEAFVALLDGVKQTSRGYVAPCPAHHDKSPSLHIAEGEGGKIILHDFAGCTSAEIVAAKGLKIADLFPDTQRDPAKIRREQAQREEKRAAAEAARKAEGLQIDARREADYFIQSRTGLDISAWTPERLDAEFTTLAAAYETLWGEFLDDRR
jgi:hypothetical protein